MIRTVYDKLWIVWGLNYLLAVIDYGSNSDKAFLLWICFIVPFLYVALPLYKYYLDKQIVQERKKREYGRNMYIGKYRAIITQNFTREEYYTYLSIFDATQAFKERNGYLD